MVKIGSCFGLGAVFFAAPTAGWSGWGGSHLNDRWAPSAGVSSTNIHSLRQRCKLSYPVGVSAPPAISDGIAYYSTWNASLVALDYKACTVKWQINVTSAVVDNFGAL